MTEQRQYFADISKKAQQDFAYQAQQFVWRYLQKANAPAELLTLVQQIG